MEPLGKVEYLTLVHYKEPLVEIKKEDGFGYYGALSGTLDGGHVQCHICGKLFMSLATHVTGFHRMSVATYREKFNLARLTALVSEKERERRKQTAIQYFVKKPHSFYVKIGKMGSKVRSKGQPKLRLETYNKRGTCPDQLIAKIQEVSERLGHTPSLAEFIDQTGGQRYKHLVFKVYGSWKRALEIAKLAPRVQAKGGYRKYATEELLEYLAMYAQETGKVPTATDSKRGLIPNYEVYIRRFGSFEKARELAGVYDFVIRETLRGIKR